jgi:hypothetical protein
MTLYGRGDELAALHQDVHRVVVVSGDIGTGKSALLDGAGSADRDSPQTTLQPVLVPAVVVDRSPGSLQRALLDALGEAIALLASDASRAQVIASNLVRAAHRLAKLQLSDLARVVAGVVLGVVRDRSGDMVADTIQSFGDQLVTSNTEVLRRPVSSATDQAHLAGC